LSIPSQVSAAGVRGTQTFVVPFTQLATESVHAPTPQDIEPRPSSASPLQLSSAPLQVSLADAHSEHDLFTKTETFAR